MFIATSMQGIVRFPEGQWRVEFSPHGYDVRVSIFDEKNKPVSEMVMTKSQIAALGGYLEGIAR